jgi:hypothetical protein
MEPKDKIVVGVLSAISALLIAFAALLPFLVPKYIHLCPKGETYDKTNRMCRRPCPGEGKGGQLYDAVKKTCSCPTVRPIYNADSSTCIPQCDAHETYDFVASACIPDVVNDCLPTPSVAPDGTILYPTHFPRGDNSCSPGTAEELSALCVASNFDEYKSGRCVRQRACSTEPCTADYCTSDSVVATLGTVYKKSRADDVSVCENPTQAEVGDMCAVQPGHVWKPPNCYKDTLQRTIRVDFDDNYPPTTALIQGTLVHPLLNANDVPILYTWTLFTLEGAVVGEGQCAVASCGTDCTAFVISLSNVMSGAHLLDIQGRPSWNASLVLYTTDAPQTVYLLPSTNTPGTTAALNPQPSLELAQQLAKNQAWVQDTLQSLQATNSRLIVPTIPADVELAIADDPTLTQSALIVGCVKAYCRADQGQVKQKLVILAWPAVTAEQADCAPELTVVKYMLLRVQDGAVVELIGPSSQPLIKTSTVSFVDVLEINSNVQYILAAYLVSPADGLDKDYATSECKSQEVFVAVRVGDYSAQFCKTIPAPMPAVLPPYYWRDSRTGMCEWAVNVQGARDYYCMFDQGTGGDPAANLNLNKLHFATPEETCVEATKSAPKVVQTWRDQYCLPESAGGNYPNSACISGILQNSSDKIARVKCTNSILDGQVTQSDFRARLDQVVEYSKSNNVFADVDSKVAALTGAANQDALWKSSYYSCGPADAPSTWGTVAPNCNGDEACQLLARTSGCDRNYCMPWQPEGGGSYVQPRVCYPPSNRIDGSTSPCCNKLGTYSFTATTTGDRGKCTNCGVEFGGAQCTENKCLGVDCNGAGDCVINQQTGEAQCLCFANYYNVQKQTHVMTKDDCDRTADSAPNCQYDIVVDGKVVPNSNCKLDRFKCKCPEPAVDMKACIRNADPAQSVYSVRTGCPVPCAYGKTPSTSNPYCFKDPLANNMTCGLCKTDGNKCDSNYRNGPYECCSGKCENHWTDWTHTAQEHRCTGT